MIGAERKAAVPYRKKIIFIFWKRNGKTVKILRLRLILAVFLLQEEIFCLGDKALSEEECRKMVDMAESGGKALYNFNKNLIRISTCAFSKTEV